MKFKDLAAFNTALEAAVLKGIEQDIVPIFKGVVMEAANALVRGAYGYVGTPEWSGNAAANWWPSVDGAPQPFVEYFMDVPRPSDPDFPANFEPPYSATSPRTEAEEMSISRIAGFLRELPGIPKKVVLENTAAYLLAYQPYGVGPVFRMENRYPLSAMRAAMRLNEEISTASRQQLDQWKVGFK